MKQQFQAGQLGYQVQVPVVPPLNGTVWAGARMLFSDPRDNTPRAWSVTLGAMRYEPSAPGNQGVQAGSGSTPLAANIFMEPLYSARVTWGVGAGSHTAMIDWPFGGCTLQVAAESVTVDAFARLPQRALPSAFGAGLPLLSATMVSTVGSGRGAGAYQPTWTEELTGVDAASTALFYRPPFAVGYRLVYNAAAALAPQWSTAQQTEAGVTHEFDGHTPTTIEATPLASPESLTSNRGAFFRLMPATQRVQVVNRTPGGGGVLTASVQWLLDLG